jgi:hypothetical protein
VQALQLRLALTFVGQAVVTLGASSVFGQGPAPSLPRTELLVPGAWRSAEVAPGTAATTSDAFGSADLLVPVEWTAPVPACGALLQPGSACMPEPELITPADWGARAGARPLTLTLALAIDVPNR